MIGSLDKSYNRPILVDEDHLRYLAGIVEERFCAVEYEIKTIDGAKYKLPTIDDLITYNNPDSRKIVSISISGYKNKDVMATIQNSQFHFSVCRNMMHLVS